MSISTVTTAPAWSASRAVSDPVPVPTSSTASDLSSSAVRTIRSTQVQVDEEVLAEFALGLQPVALEEAAEVRERLARRGDRLGSVWHRGS